MAAHGLQENTGLLGFVVAAKVAMVGVVLPLGVLLTLSYTNGDLAPNRELAALHMLPLAAGCFNAFLRLLLTVSLMKGGHRPHA